MSWEHEVSLQELVFWNVAKNIVRLGLFWKRRSIMCKKLICLVSIILVLGLAGTVSAELIAPLAVRG